jgi:hypothetical protein
MATLQIASRRCSATKEGMAEQALDACQEIEPPGHWGVVRQEYWSE